MSNKMESPDMEQESTGGLKPKLRFPEFQNAPSWSKKQLEDALSPIVRQRKKPANPYTGLGIRSHGKGTFLKTFEIPEKNAMEFLYEVQSEDLIINITFAWEGAIAIAQQPDAGALVSHRFPTYTFKRNIAIPEFFQYIIVDKQFIYKLGVISPGGAGRNRVLNKNDFLKLSVLIPELKEQQKIADCLFTLDDLINAQSQKLEVLKTHKKGLMQQLFPAEGETLPRLRFPEFQDAPEWEELPLGKVLSLEYGGSLSEHNRNTGMIPVVGSNGIVGYHDYFLVEGPAIVIGRKGSAGKVNWITSDCFPIDTTFYVKNKSENDFLLLFLKQILENSDLERLKDNGAVPGLNRNEVYNVKSFLPKIKEQQKIVDCLTSLEDLITAHSQKLEALKTYKKGLMQQLFPTLGEDEA